MMAYTSTTGSATGPNMAASRRRMMFREVGRSSAFCRRCVETVRGQAGGAERGMCKGARGSVDKMVSV